MPHAITPEYFNANGYSLLQGHAFTDADNASAMPVGIIDEETAKHVFPGATAVGRRLKLGPPSSNAPWITIVGVVAASGCLKTETCVFRPVLYRPLGQVELAPYGFLTFVVRTRGPDESLKPAIRAAVREADPTIVVMRLFSAESRWEDVIAPLRANAVVLGGFALFALLIAGVGTYGVLAYLVNQRTAEIGIRMALGATSANVRGLVLRSVAMTVLVGIAAGAAGSFALTRLLRSMLYATSPTDPMVFAAAALTLAGVAMLAAYLPARRAAKVDPMIALRVG
jgi:putative ABC transport system permease protein